MAVDLGQLGLGRAMEWRCIGPHRGGRVVAVAGHPTERMAFYFGACAGGVWKTTDGGTYWENISDGFFRTASVGAIAVAEADPNVIYVGTGEACIRVDVSHGDGVYKSTDGGKTWAHVGLEDTRHIGRIRVHPKDPNIVYVAALGHAFGPNQQRGVFRSTDGGKTWERVLFRSENTGAIDLAMDPNNPRVLYAALWQVRRSFWELSSGGPESGIFRSTDGGDTWVELTRNPGLPRGILGRIGVAVSPARPDRVWAIIEAEDGALFRSDDGGQTWERVSEDRELRQRPWYYHHVFADPQGPDTVWVLNLRAWKSTDGGRTFTPVPTPHGDNHDLWIDPQDPNRMIEGNDGGACVSFDGGATWSTIYNQPTAQFYHVATDNRFPYRVYGTQQDNTAICVPSRSMKGAILWADCYPVGSSESGHIAVRPDNPDVVYSGAIGSAPGGGGVMLRYDHATGQVRIITVWPEPYGGWGAKDLRYRFQWTYPIVISPHDPNVLYCAGNVIFRSTDEGASWEPISPDLTRNDPSKLGPSGGPITKDTTGAEHYCTVFALAESPHEAGVFWAGSDDGLVHISRDGGKTWQNVTPPDLPEWTLISTIEVSPHDPAKAYIAATRYKLDDFQPYLYKTEDYGQTWTRIDGDLPRNDFTRVIREDPVRPGLLYVGTETGVYVSQDDGVTWQSLRLNLPVVPVYDLTVKDSDLVAATHGRSFWILDDLTALRELQAEALQAPAALLPPRPAYRWPPPIGSGRPAGPGKNYMVALGVPATFYERKGPDGKPRRVFLDAGQNPPEGAIIYYHLREKPQGEVTLAILDAEGKEVRRWSGPRKADEADGDDERGEDTLPAEQGLNRWVWDLRYPNARALPGDVTTERSLAGPQAPPGTYTVRLTVDGQVYEQTLEVRVDPRVTATPEELRAQFDFLIQVRDRLSQTHEAILRLRSIRDQVDQWVRRAQAVEGAQALVEAGEGLRRRLTEVEEELVQTRAKGALDTINFPTRLNAKLAALSAVASAADFAPTKQAYEVLEDVWGRIRAQLDRLRQLEETDLRRFMDLVHELDLPPVVPTVEG